VSLLDRSVSDFLGAVASVDEPVPAGACAAALTGASAAALVVLIVRVVQHRREPPDVSGHEARGMELQTRLEQLIDEDAAAYQAYVDARKLPKGPERTAALANATRTPLDIGRACLDVAAIAQSIAPVATGSIQSDIQVAYTLAKAAASAALTTASANIASLAESAERTALQQELEQLKTSSS
jgi:methenyltetrahydrofolate cyclohydrolase